MKKAVVSAALAISALALCSCNITRVGPVYTDVAAPVTSTCAGASGKVGKATTTCYLGLWAEGDASIDTAKKNGGITTVSSVDVSVDSIHGIITTYTTTVRGN
jgi:hypothetical protein